MTKAKDEKKYYRIPADLRNINYDIHSKKNTIIKEKEPYSSDNTRRLIVNDVVDLLKKQKEIFKEIN